MNAGVVRDWVELFYNGEEEYQSDEKWYELILQAERAKKGPSSGGMEAAGDLPIDFAGSEEQGEEGSSDQEETGSESDEYVVVTNGSSSSECTYVIDDELSRKYELEFDQNVFSVLVEARVVEGAGSKRPFTVEAAGFVFKFDYNPRHEFFEQSLDTATDCLLIDLSQHFLAVAAESPRNYPVSIIERNLRKKYFPNTLSDVTQVADEAEAMLRSLKEFVDESLPDIAPIDISKFSAEAVDKIRRRALQSDLGDDESVNEKIKTGQFISYVDSHFLLQVVGFWPALVMDGKFFSNPYDGLRDSLKDEAVAMLLNGLEDVRWLSEDAGNTIAKDLAWRLRYARAISSMRLVESWRS